MEVKKVCFRKKEDVKRQWPEECLEDCTEVTYLLDTLAEAQTSTSHCYRYEYQTAKGNIYW